jgi:signal transduction histidine kinase
VEEAISYYPPEWREKITKVFTQCAQNGIPYDEEMEIITANGRRVWVRTIGEPLKDESGKIIKVQGTFQDITERKRSEEALLNSREEMRSLSIRLQVAREEERIRIARKIHDEIGGLLTGLKIDLSLLLKTSLEIQDKTIKKSLLDGIESMIKSIDVSVPEIRRLAMELRPGVLDELGFVAAIEWHLHDFQKRTGITCQWISSVKYINVGIDLSTALFRIFQEALTNVARHSGATEVRAYLRAGEQSFVLEVEDNGKGFEKENLLSSESLGFMGMKERVQMFGGSVTITGKPGIGTKVTVNIPSMEKRKPDQEGDAG